ncbi:DUF3823 domain-containing protein [Compostibacter hankyongensis]|uniref:DUF3823 domain-containing protein n=1 Tax=Compostibacter hankyongensis TaxID=1007089 RepID=A0ABP8FG54_9BACT
MKRRLYYMSLILAVLAAGSCKKLDNYDGPTETLTGNILDANTGKNVQSEVSGDNGNGTRIKLLEISWSDNPTPLYLACKEDGTYSNKRVFAATYKMSAEGAFVPMVQGDDDKSKTVEVKGGVTNVDFEVEPFLEVEWVGDPVLNADSTVSARVKITRGTKNPGFQQEITDLWLFVSPTQYCGNNNYDNRYSAHVVYSGTAGDSILGQTITLKTIGGALPSKRDWYFRIGARINYGLKQYNYNEARMIAVP